MMKPVLTKQDFVRRYWAGEFGNHAPTWNSYTEWLASTTYETKQGLYHVRNRVAAARTWYNVPADALAATWYVACHQYSPDQLYISQMCPTEKTLFQGEVMRGLWGLDLHYTTVAKPMREALATKALDAQGIISSCFLKHFLCSNSYEWLMYLLEEYEDHVVEFTTLSVDWGTLPGFNTIFWEVRGGY